MSSDQTFDFPIKLLPLLLHLRYTADELLLLRQLLHWTSTSASTCRSSMHQLILLLLHVEVLRMFFYFYFNG